MLEKQFPNFALFTTLLRRVRLSQSVGCKTTIILHFWRLLRLRSVQVVANPVHCLSFGQICLRVGHFDKLSASLLTAAPFMPTLTEALERGTSRLKVKILGLKSGFFEKDR
jgi:hypothetical protein